MNSRPSTFQDISRSGDSYNRISKRDKEVNHVTRSRTLILAPTRFPHLTLDSFTNPDCRSFQFPTPTMPKNKLPSHLPPLPFRFFSREEGRVLMSQPFLGTSSMDGSLPGCSLEDFRQPLLRQCAFDPKTLSFTGRINKNPDPRTGTGLDGGLDGYNWKVRFGKSETFILKIVSRQQGFGGDNPFR